MSEPLAVRYADEFPIRERFISFNHASVCPLPRRAVNAATAVLKRQMLAGTAEYEVWATGIKNARRKAARLLHADNDEVAFVKNTTQGLIIAAESIPWQPGDNVVVSAVEFPANVYPWLNLERRGVETRFFGMRQGRICIDDIAQAMDRRTRAVAISWVQFANGFRCDLGKISALCREHKAYLVVDAIQGLGALQMDARRYHIDFLAADGHKWLLGVEGCGVLYVRRQILGDLVPFNVGWLSVENAWDLLDYQMDLLPSAGRFEEGSMNVVGIHALGASMELMLEAGPPRIEREILALTDYLAEKLQQIGCEITSPRENDGEKSGIVTFRHPRLDSEELARRLTARGVLCQQRTGNVRFSPHFYNTRDEVDRAVQHVLRAGQLDG